MPRRVYGVLITAIVLIALTTVAFGAVGYAVPFSVVECSE